MWPKQGVSPLTTSVLALQRGCRLVDQGISSYIFVLKRPTNVGISKSVVKRPRRKAMGLAVIFSF